MILNRSALLIAVSATLVASSLGASAAAPASSDVIHVVSMQSFAYSPSALTIRVGDSVRWTYDERATSVPAGCENPAFRTPAASCPGHSVTSVDRVGGHRLFDTGLHRAAGFPFTYRFTRPGRYSYFCTAHGGAHANNPLTAMNGQVVVRAR